MDWILHHGFVALGVEEMIYLFLKVILYVIYLYQLAHAPHDPMVRSIRHDTFGFALVLGSMVACWIHWIWTMGFCFKSILLCGMMGILWVRAMLR